MDVADLAVSAAWRQAGWLLALPLLGWAAWRGDWSRYRESEPVHAFLGALAAMVALWSMRGSVGSFAFHLLGTAVLALGAGVPRALAGGAVVVALVTLLRGAPPENAAWAWLLLVALPAGCVALVAALLRRLPANFFVYVFVGAFWGGALSFGASALAAATFAVAAAGVDVDVVLGQYVPVLLVLAFGEGSLTGMLITLAVVYRPAWVATFDDARYLRRR